MRHAPFPLDRAARDRWVSIMNNTLDEAQIPADVADLLRQFFDAMATFLINKPS
jgi:hemoglobin